MKLNTIVYLVTMVVTWILGYVAKKHTSLNNNLIPIQNILIGVIVAVIEWIVTKDFNTALTTAGVMGGGTYDIIHNLNKIRRGE